MIRQKTWGPLALGHYVFGGTGSGLYAAAFTLNLVSPGSLSSVFSYVSILSVALVASGLTCVGLEAGRKSRAANVILNVRSSWMSREAVGAFLFLALALAGLAFGNMILYGVAALFALLVIVGQGFMLSAARAIPAWRTPLTPPLLWISSVAAGLGLLGVVLLFSPGIEVGTILPGAVAVLSTLVTVVALTYLLVPGKSSALKKIFDEGSNRLLFLFSIVVGGLVPLLISFDSSGPVFAISLISPLLIAGSCLTKYSVLLRLSYRAPVIDFGETGHIFDERA